MTGAAIGPMIGPLIGLKTGLSIVPMTPAAPGRRPMAPAGLYRAPYWAAKRFITTAS